MGSARQPYARGNQLRLVFESPLGRKPNSSQGGCSPTRKLKPRYVIYGLSETVSIARLYVLRGMYLLNFLLVGSGVCAEFVHRQKPWDQITGAVFAFWGALSLLSLLGIRYPISMIPILLLQACYKVLWFPLAYFPLRTAGRSSDLGPGFLVAIALDLIVIPWPYTDAITSNSFRGRGRKRTNNAVSISR